MNNRSVHIHHFTYHHQTYTYTVRLLRTRKKTISIHINPDASVEVRAPLRARPQQIEALVHKKAGWIAKHVEKFRAEPALFQSPQYIHGEDHFYLGNQYPLHIVKSATNKVCFTNDTFEIRCKSTEKAAVKLQLDKWYKQQAHTLFQQRLQMLCEQIDWLSNTPPMKIRIMKKRWGSCSTKGNINLNRHLIKAPMACIDYVIAHELCHLKEHNHSKRYYALLDTHYPDWKATKAKLNELAPQLLNN